MSSRTSILEENYTAYPNELIRNYNNLLSKNERNLMIFLWDRLYGYEYPKNELSYSIILKDCKDFPKNNAKLSEAIKGLEGKGLLKVFRTNRNTNKYYIGEKQYKTLQWYGKNFKGWKEGVIEPPIELFENETEPKTLFDELVEMEREQVRGRGKEKIVSTEIKNQQETQIEEPVEKIYLHQLTENEFMKLYPDMNIVCKSFYRNQTMEQFDKTAEGIRNRINRQPEKIEEPVEPELSQEELDKEFENVLDQFFEEETK